MILPNLGWVTVTRSKLGTGRLGELNRELLIKLNDVLCSYEGSGDD